MSYVHNVLSTTSTRKKFLLAILIVILLIAGLVYKGIATNQETQRLIQSITIDTYDQVFSYDRMTSIHGGLRKSNVDNATAMDVTYQLTAQDVQRLITAKRVLTCPVDDNDCRADELGQVFTSTGGYMTSVQSAYGYSEIELYIDTDTNTATWVFRR